MRDPRLWVLALLLAILAGLFFFRSGQRELPPEKNAARLEVRSGEAMADLVDKQLSGSKNIVLIARSPDADQSANQITEAFQQQADKRGLTLVKTLNLGASKRMAESMQVPSLSAAWIDKALSGLDNVDAIVSLCGEPQGKLSELESLPPFFCLCDQGERIPELIKAAIVRGAYVPRRSPPDAKWKNDWFNMLYELALPETVDVLYAE